MKAILIDPKEKIVSEVEYDGDYKKIYDFIEADTFEVVTLEDNGDGVFIDECGLFKDYQYMWTYNSEKYQGLYGRGTPICGKALMLGLDESTGDSIAPTTSRDSVDDCIEFLGVARITSDATGFKYTYLHQDEIEKLTKEGIL
jgi:hypothetical protein